MHEYGGIPGVFHGGGVYLIGGEQAYSLCPYSIRLAHGYPYVGVDNVGVGGTLLYVLGEGDGAAVFRRDGTAGIHQLLGGEQRLWRAGGEVKAHLGAGHHEGIAHVVAGVPHVGEVYALEAAQLFLDGEQVRKHLGGVELIRKAVPYRNSGVFGKLLDKLLAVTPVLYAVVHPAQHPRRVGYALLFAHLRGAGVKIGHAHSEIAPGNLKGAAGAGGGLFKEQHYVFAVKVLMRHPGSLHALEVL